ncbi:CYC protein, partial [Indicator maculatus]|nr:CYC protein [Indicator maculatus]
LGDDEKAMIFIQKCSWCHSVEKNRKHRTETSLWGLFAHRTGKDAEFFYSKQEQNIFINKWCWDNIVIYCFLVAWSENTLMDYLENPKNIYSWYKKKKKFAGITKQNERADLIAYLKKATS